MFKWAAENRYPFIKLLLQVLTFAEVASSKGSAASFKITEYMCAWKYAQLSYIFNYWKEKKKCYLLVF